jgi:glycolate oxidase FAD binding subunit
VTARVAVTPRPALAEAPTAADRDALRKAAGDAAVEEHAPVAVDEVGLACTVTPPDGDALARTLACLAERGLPAVVRGGGSRLGLGNPPRVPRLLLSTRALTGVLELDPAEGVLCARAGTPLAVLRDALADTAWELPLDPPGAGTSLGGVLAAGASGPRVTGNGRPRDLVLGLAAVLGDGLPTRCGGRVVKNVTGYDLMKLHVGALGSLGVIESAWLRLRPRPRAEHLLSAALEGPDPAAQALAAARRSSVRAAALIAPSLAAAVEPSRAGSSTWLLLVELAGEPAGVAEDARALADRHGAGDASPGALARVRALQGETFGPAGLHFRLAVLSARLAEAIEPLARAGATLLAYPAAGVLHARFDLDREVDAAGLDAAWRAAREAGRAGGGHAVLEAAPAWAKDGRDVFDPPPELAGLARALKQRFDPAGVLNPGRFAGRL